MASDLASTGGGQVDAPKNPKIFVRNGMLIGAAGSWRLIQQMMYKPDMPTIQDGQDMMEYLCTSFVDFLPQFEECRIIIGADNRIFSIGSGLGVNEHEEYYAVGSGEEFALGSLYSTIGAPAESRVRMAILAANRFSASCGGGVKVLIM